MKRFALVALATILASCGLAAPAPPAVTTLELTPAPIRLVVHRAEDWPTVLAAYRTMPRAVAFYAPWERTIHARTIDWRANLPHEMSHALEHLRAGIDYSLDPACVARDPPNASYWCQRTEETARAFERAFFASCPLTALGLFGVPGDAVCTPQEDSMKLTTGARNGILESGLDTQFNSGILEIYSGSRPATPDLAPTGTLLCSITLPADAFAAAASGAKAKNGTWSGVGAAAAAAGTPAGWARFKQAGDTGTVDDTKVRLDCTVTGTGGGGDIELDNVSIAQAQAVNVSSFSITLPVGT